MLRRWQYFLEPFEAIPHALDVEFRAQHSERAGCKGFVIGGEFMAHDLEACDRVFGDPFGDVDDMHQKAGSFDVAKELEAQTLALMCPLDQPWDIGDDEGLPLVPSHNHPDWE